ncbi:RNA methyltransferase [Thermogladius sp.]|uniref:RNA methyltransferase n=1 Tax=Thermogladius sp. TaxID=2023064 RepID=UPI003D102E7B
MITRVVLVGVEGAYNLGVIARTCVNFGVEELYLVKPKADLNEALNYSAKAREYLSRAVVVEDLKSALEGVDLSVSTSDEGFSRGDVLRQAVTLEKLLELVRSRGVNRLGIVFGRESTGLTREEIAQTDLLVTIPANPEYPALNLAQAVAVVLWEAWKMKGAAPTNVPPLAPRERLDRIVSVLSELTDLAVSPEDKRRRIKTVLRRVVYRSGMSELEARTVLYMLMRLKRRVSR